jgi:hypothetical protein
MDAYEMDAYFPKNSLLLGKNSLILLNISLLIELGNCSKSCCGTAVSWSASTSKCLKFAKFPVKFPDSREIARRQARSTLRRQPGIPEAGGATPQRAEKSAVGALLQLGAGL